MKKIFAVILTIAMLMTAAAAIAEGQGGPMGGPQQGQMRQGSQQGGMGPQGDRGQQPPEKPSGEKGQQPPEKPSGEQGQQAPQKPDAAPEKPSGEKPADAPEEPEDLTGEKPADAPEMPSGEKPADGQQPRKADDKRIDFDAMVTSGVISQETRDKIMAYMNEHKPKGAPADGQQPPEKPADDQAPTDGQQPDLLSDLLNAGVITQAEYDALVAAQTAA